VKIIGKPVTNSPTISADLANKSRGAIYTQDWFASFLVDLTGLTGHDDLRPIRVVEPSCGDGAILAELVRRFVASAFRHGYPVIELADCIVAFDIDPIAVETSRLLVDAILIENHVAADVRAELTQRWVREGDFLLEAPGIDPADVIVGNPPYVRPEHVSVLQLSKYREAWTTMRGRADIYVGFFEAALSLGRNDNSRLVFLSADRWMRNQYGQSLRELVVADHTLLANLELHDADIFDRRVDAYPSVTIIGRGQQTADKMLSGHGLHSFQEDDAVEFTAAYFGGPGHLISPTPALRMEWTQIPSQGSASWPAGTTTERSLLTEIESRLPSLTETGVTVGVGLATGADSVFFIQDPTLIEPERLRRVVQPSDLGNEISWGGNYLVNPWEGDDLVDLNDFPMLSRYLHLHRVRLENRHVAKREGTPWWRTIDKPKWKNYEAPKLLLPDLKTRVAPTLDIEGFVPKHTISYLLSTSWDLEVLGGILLSDRANNFVKAYSVKFSGGHMRISGQYLKKIRVPDPNTILLKDRKMLADAFRNRNVNVCNKIADRLYGITT